MGKSLIYFTFCSSAVFLGFTNILNNNNLQFFLLSAILVLYNLFECFLLFKRNKKYFYINPVVLAVIANFFAYLGGVSNFLLIEDGIYQVDVFASPLLEETHWLRITMGYTFFAAVFMWLGYKFSAGRLLAEIFISDLKYRRFLGSNLKLGLIIVLAIAGYLIKVILLKNGLYGRLVDASVHEGFLYSQLRFLRNFSTLPFILISLLYFRYNTSNLKFLFIVTFLLEFLFASITGARGPVLILSIIVFLAYYYNKQKIRTSIILYIALTFYLAFTVIMQFKDFNHSENLVGQSIPELFSNFMEYRRNLTEGQKDRIYGALLYNVATRLNFVDEAAMAIRFKNVEGLGPQDPDFVRPLYMIPVDIFIPKFIQGTPNVSWGYWFLHRIYKPNHDLVYNIAFSPIGYLYIAGGPLLIFIGFFTYGILLKAARQLLEYGILGFIIYMILLSSLAVYKTGVAVVYVGFFRAMLVMPILIGLVFKKMKLN